MFKKEDLEFIEKTTDLLKEFNEPLPYEITSIKYGVEINPISNKVEEKNIPTMKGSPLDYILKLAHPASKTVIINISHSNFLFNYTHKQLFNTY